MRSFRYDRRTGLFVVEVDGNSHVIGTGFAGAEGYRNDPTTSHLRGKGPLPKGVYRLRVVPHQRFAAPAIKADQIEGETFGRSGFYIHGGTKSEGCIILQRQARGLISWWIKSGVDRLEVV